MVNVLPQSAQKKLWRTYRSRLLIALSGMLTVLALASLLALFPGYLALSLFAPPPSESDATGERSEAAVGVELGRAQALIRVMSPILSATTSPSALITEVVSLKPPSVSIGHITYSVQEKRVLLTGSGGREAITEFRDALSKSPHVAQVSVPVSELVGTADSRFSMTITLAL